MNNPRLHLSSILFMYIETVVQLSKGEIDSKEIRVEFPLEDMDMSGSRKAQPMSRLRRMC